ncbi:MAG: DUF1015 domain-containing protein, partial [Oscillospiraceae bacterium]|nr:DUF1015 domain-containing protein [Oscillospiraceae bacterium]
MKHIFRRADILLPQGCDLKAWSVVACDQFSSQPEYWAARDAEIGGAPSALRLMLPEAYLGSCDPLTEAEKINAEMKRYLASGVFRELKDSFVYLERTLAGGAVRRGLLGVLDLEAYDYSAGSSSPIRATEGTITSRLPPRVRVREGAPLEMPHIMVFADDPEDSVLAPLAGKLAALPQLYAFPLSAGGGYLRGWQVTGAEADAVDAAVDRLCDPAALRARYGSAAPVIFAMGDGNHSLAAAKKCWEDLVKPGLTAEERETHPARFALAELVNIHDPAVTFEPIHRCLFGTDPAAFLPEAREFFAGHTANSGRHALRLVTPRGEDTLRLDGLSIGRLIGAADQFCQDYISRHGGEVDYIHNDETALAMGQTPGQAALLLPKMEKNELFPSVARTGPFPKKSFSIGLAQDKRYYL